jgi:hypothetical protein
MATKKPGAKKGHPVFVRKVTFTTKMVAATDDGCLAGDDALALVEGELLGPHVSPDTKLKDIFPDSTARQLFCSRVSSAAQAAGCNRSFPCQPGTTIGDIADALSC